MFCRKEHNDYHMNGKFVFVLIISTVIMITACGREKDTDSSLNEEHTIIGELAGTDKTENTVRIPSQNKTIDNTISETQSTSNSGSETNPSVPQENDSAVYDNNELKKKFGKDCIAEQTFEVKLSEYDGKVWFVPFAPSENNPKFEIQIIQDGEVLETISAYVPDKLRYAKFHSLDAVCFYDVNYDNKTDIILVETYGSTSFAAIYYGYDDGPANYERGFTLEILLSENVSDRLENVSIPEIINFLTCGKKNGSFTDYSEAYKAKSFLIDLESNGKMKYDLIYFDEDNTPELAAGINGYYVSLYTFHDGNLYTLMNNWGYGAMGNAGYEYLPGKNSMRNYNADFAGAIMKTTYMTIGANHTMDTAVKIVTYNFDDVNQNGVPDKDELGKPYKVNYINGVEASDEECQSYNQGEYEFITTSMSLETLNTMLN